ncbi:MAG: CHASE4 domain-containing protein [Patescibacteria group bacterium]|nr:CHASE4 domain-containing protein [Patescibacteria group bacterium]
MTIRAKTVLGLVVIAAVFLVGRTVYRYVNFVEETRIAETEEIRRSLKSVEHLLDAEINRIALNVLDNAVWDDMYAFAQKPDDAFVKSNFPDFGITDIDITFAFITDRNGDVLMSKAWDLKDGSPTEIPSQIMEMATSEKGPMRPTSPDDKLSGVYAVEGVTYLLAAHPILTSENQGPVMGTLVMGRALDDELIQSFNEISGADIEISPLSIDKLKWFEGHAVSGARDMAYAANNDKSSTGAVTVKDILGHRALLIKAEIDRATYRRGYTAMIYALLSLFLMAFLMIAAILVFLDRFVLSKVSILSVQAQKAEFRPDVLQVIKGNDEISQLSRNFSLLLERLNVEKEKLKSIVESLGEGVFLCDGEGRITLANKAICDLIGLKRKPDGTVGSNVRINFHDSRTHAVRQDVSIKVLEMGHLLDVPEGLILTHKNGSETPIHLRAVPVFRNGSPIGGIFVCRDIGREKAVETTRTGFLATVSRHMAQPMERISWYLQLLSREKDKFSQDHKDAIGEIDKMTEGLLRLMEDLSMATSLEAGKNPLGKARHIDVAELVKKVMGSLSEEKRQKEIQAKITIKPGCCVLGDEKMLERVMEILASNAVKYSPQGGVIGIGCRRDGKYLSIHFSDAGIGIPQDEQDKIFKGFYRASNDRNENGFGLGLHLAKLVVEAHKGKISVESTEGQGSTFTVTFPLCGSEHQPDKTVIEPGVSGQTS